MAIKRYKPITPGTRFKTVSSFEEVTRSKPEKSLLVAIRHKAGRNAYGRITVRQRGGGNKTKYRIIDFKRDKDGVPAKEFFVSGARISFPSESLSDQFLRSFEWYILKGALASSKSFVPVR